MLKNHILILTLVHIFLWECAPISNAQNAPVTTCPVVSGSIPGIIDIPITVTGFIDIGAISLSLDYNYSIMHFVQGIPHPQLPSILSSDNDLGNGFHRITMGWYGSGTTLPNNSAIITLTFNYIAGNSPVTWYENGASCEYADASGNVLNDFPTATYYINGYLCGSTGNPGTIVGNNTTCQGQTGEKYSIAPLSNVTGYTWTVPVGAVIASGQNTNVVMVDFSGNAVSGNITACGFNACGNGPLSQLPVTVSQPPYANAGNDTTINNGTSTLLHAASGGAGSYSYHWSPEALLVNPNVQNPQTVILTTTTQFTVMVTDLAAPSCPASDEVIVTITGGPLSMNPTAMPGILCNGEYSQLFSNAGGGSGLYTYLWSCVPAGNPSWSSTSANPLVSPQSTTLYQLTLNDGFTAITGSVNVVVSQLPTATISGGDTLCGTGNFTTLQIDLTGVPPWSFTYSNGINSVTVNNQYTTPYYFNTGEPGTYSILDVQDVNCTGTSSGSAAIYRSPIPATPEISAINNTLISNACCGNQWYLDNSAIPGATGQSITATSSGMYSDIVTVNGCSSDTSEIIGLIVGVAETNEKKFSLSPNPAVDIVTIRCTSQVREPIHITITSSDGRLTGSYCFATLDERRERSLDLRGLKPGVYFVFIGSADMGSVCKLIVRQN